MSLRGFLNRVTARQAEDAGTAAPACQAESGPVVCADSGEGFPEIIESHPLPCVRPAVVRVQFRCLCGHAGTRLSCAECAEPGPRQVCAKCMEECQHACPVELRRQPLS